MESAHDDDQGKEWEVQGNRIVNSKKQSVGFPAASRAVFKIAKRVGVRVQFD